MKQTFLNRREFCPVARKTGSVFLELVICEAQRIVERRRNYGGVDVAISKLVAIPSGAVYVAPAQVLHFVAAKDEAVFYQETGIGPTGTALVKP